MDPDFTTAHYQLGWIYQQSGQFQQAIQSLERVVSLQPNSASACNTLAMFYLERDYRLDEALALAKRAVKFKPISSYWDTLAYSLYKNRNMKKQTKQLKRRLNCNLITLSTWHVSELFKNTSSSSKLVLEKVRAKGW